MVLSVLLIFFHIRTIVDVRDVSVPIVRELPQLEFRLRALQEQVELTELRAATITGSEEEKVAVFVLPTETDISRLVATFEVLRDTLKRDGLLSHMSDIVIGDPTQDSDGTQARTVTVEFTVHEEGLRTILLLIRLAGLMTVSDLLSEQEIAILVDRIEQENPSGIVALEQFFSADVLRYAEDPKTYEEQLKRSFTSSGVLQAIDSVLRTSLLSDVKRFLGSDLGKVLQTYKLWPMQIMALKEVSIQPGNAPKWQTLALKIIVFSAEK